MTMATTTATTRTSNNSDKEEEEETRQHRYLPHDPPWQRQGEGWGQGNNDMGTNGNKDCTDNGDHGNDRRSGSMLINLKTDVDAQRQV